MNKEIWQQLLSLESRDITSQWFERIHYRELNARRAQEINAAAKQAREYFRNANDSSYSVRPLLTFYGVACLSRSLLLLLKAQGGEEGLNRGHGLETVGWANILSGDVAPGLRKLGDLKVRTTTGLFSDFIKHTKNRFAFLVRSTEMPTHICYDIPQLGDELSLCELFARIPDLQKEYTNISGDVQYAVVSKWSYNDENGFKADVKEDTFSAFKDIYLEFGYEDSVNSDWTTITADAETFKEQLPLFIQTYVLRAWGLMPALYLLAPFPSGARYSQLCITYVVSYILGMLVRYYPTHWIALTQGEKGDIWWPTINRAQQIVENSYPELVIELIMGMLAEPNETNIA